MLGIASWPLVKLWYLGPSERLTGIDVRLLALGSLVGVAALSVALLAVVENGKFRRSFDKQLDWLAEKVSVELSDHLIAGHAQLRRIITSEAARLQSLDRAQTVPFDRVLCADRRGEIIHEWKRVPGGLGIAETEPANLPSVTVADRPYFHDAERGNVWRLENTCAKPGTAETSFSVGVVTSKVGGDTVAALAENLQSIPIARPGCDVGIIALEMSRFLHAVLPIGFDFAVIDQDGEVQLHSDAQRSLNENLFDATGGDRPLMAAVRERRASRLSVNYLGRETRIALQVIPGTSWTVVAFWDEGVLDTVAAEALVSWAVLFGGYLLALVLLLLVIHAVRDRYRAPWLWPARDYEAGSRNFAICSWLLLSSAMLCWRSGYHGSSEKLLLVLLTLAIQLGIACLVLGRPALRSAAPPAWDRWAASTVVLVSGVSMIFVSWYMVWALIGAGLVAVFLRFKTEDLFQREGAYRLSYATMLLALAGAVSVAPATILFVDARAQAVLESVRLGQTTLLEGLLRQTQDASPKAAQSQPLHRRAEFAPPWLGWEATRQERQLASAVLEWLPAYRQTASELRATADDAEHVGWGWAKQPVERRNQELKVTDGRLVKLLDKHPIDALAHLWRDKDREPPSWTIWDLVLCLTGGAMLVVFGVSLVWSIGRLVFLLDIDKLRARDVDVSLNSAIGRWRYGSQAGVVGPKQLDLSRQVDRASVSDGTLPVRQPLDVSGVEAILDDPCLQASLLGRLEARRRFRPDDRCRPRGACKAASLRPAVRSWRSFTRRPDQAGHRGINVGRVGEPLAWRACGHDQGARRRRLTGGARRCESPR